VRIGADNFLSAELENKTQHAMGGRVLRTEVDGVMADLPFIDVVLALSFSSSFWVLQALRAIRVVGLGEIGIDGLERGALGELGSTGSS
jgi:hypothetical protein